MAYTFCGNPTPHHAHDFDVEGYRFACDGVHTKPGDEYVEKFDPEVEAKEDGADYKKVTIMIEDANGDLTIVHCAKASMPWVTAKTDEAVPLDKSSINYYPNVTKVHVEFQPHLGGETPPLTIERRLHDADV